MMLDVDMFAVSVMSWIIYVIYCSLIIDIKSGQFIVRYAKFSK